MASLATAEKAAAGPARKPVSTHEPMVSRAPHTADVLPKCTACAAGGVPCAACSGVGGAGLLQRQLLGNNRSGSLIQAKLTVGEPNDVYEQEADRVAEQVMSMAPPATPNIQRQSEEEQEEVQTKPLLETITPIVQRQEALEEDEPIQAKCESCEEEERVQRSPHGAPLVQADLENRLNASKRGGSPLPDEVRSYMESRFRANFKDVRVHTDNTAIQMNRELNAQAFTHRQNIYFGAGKSPGMDALTAHELTHVAQQGAVPSIQNRFTNGNSEQRIHRNELYGGLSDYVVQRFPGDGMDPPGDCNWAQYLLLRGSVETAKAVVSTLGACSAGDSCLFLATKIAAITAEIAARVVLDATCFKGGDKGHRQQVQDKINMMNRCYRFFSGSNCSPELIAAMAVVVERAREVIAAGAVVVAAALVVALIAAIVALAKVIAALAAAAAAAAAEGAAVGAAAAAVIALLVTISEGLSSEET